MALTHEKVDRYHQGLLIMTSCYDSAQNLLTIPRPLNRGYLLGWLSQVESGGLENRFASGQRGFKSYSQRFSSEL